MKKAPLVWVGDQQFVVLPEEFRFEGPEIAISRDTVTGDVVLSGTTHRGEPTACPPERRVFLCFTGRV